MCCFVTIVVCFYLFTRYLVSSILVVLCLLLSTSVCTLFCFQVTISSYCLLLTVCFLLLLAILFYYSACCFVACALSICHIYDLTDSCTYVSCSVITHFTLCCKTTIVFVLFSHLCTHFLLRLRRSLSNASNITVCSRFVHVLFSINFTVTLLVF